jgi:uncharacterized membrane protein
MAFMRLPLVFREIRIKKLALRLAVFLLAGIVLSIWLYATPKGLLGKSDAIGYAVCHRIDLRSYHLGDRTLPMCSRCTGTFLGVVVALSYFALFKRRASQFPSKVMMIFLALFGFGYAIDGLNSYLHLIPTAPHVYTPNNTLRLTTGVFFGIALASIVFPGINQSLWVFPDPKPGLESFKDLGLISFMGIIVILAVWSENPLLLYPLAIISTGGVLILLTLVYTMVILILLRRENYAASWCDLTYPLVGGFTLAIAQIGLIDLGRYLLMGTWEGFNFL